MENILHTRRKQIKNDLNNFRRQYHQYSMGMTLFEVFLLDDINIECSAHYTERTHRFFYNQEKFQLQDMLEFAYIPRFTCEFIILTEVVGCARVQFIQRVALSTRRLICSDLHQSNLNIMMMSWQI